MRVSTWLWSLLEREFRQSPGDFAQKFAGTWLIWEPGAWRPARTTRDRNRLTTLNLATPEAVEYPPRPAGTDAFCFQLELSGDEEVVVGRASTCDVLINELTMSRAHLRVRADSVCVDPTCRQPTTIGDEEMATGVWRPLRDGLAITTGALRLTWHDGEGLRRRLAQVTGASRLTG
ncbi:MAG: hypothetical protein ACOZQL_21210 [Myxococcota bacterium]